MLTYDESFNNTDNLSTNQIDFGVPLTAESLNAQTQPTANANGTSGFSWNDALKSVVNMFDTGLQAYNSVQTSIGQAQIAKAQTQATVAQQRAVLAPATTQPVVMGLNQTQLLWIAGGLAGILAISLIARRGR